MLLCFFIVGFLLTKEEIFAWRSLSSSSTLTPHHTTYSNLILLNVFERRKFLNFSSRSFWLLSLLRCVFSKLIHSGLCCIKFFFICISISMHLNSVSKCTKPKKGVYVFVCVCMCANKWNTKLQLNEFFRKICHFSNFHNWIYLFFLRFETVCFIPF